LSEKTKIKNMQKSKASIALLVAGVVFVTPSLFAIPAPMPDAGSSALLLTIGFGGLAFARKFFSK
jgi:hypothetical protein